MLTVDFLDDDSYVSHDEQDEISSLLNYAYKKLEPEGDAEVSISFVDSESIKDINHQYRNKNEVTDVISFALEDDGINLVHEDAPRTLGDIIVSTERAEGQAEEYGHSYRRELLFLSLHGFLHLLGYDHIDKEDENEMNQTQDDILSEFGVSREGRI